jgi:hypothetical protein
VKNQKLANNSFAKERQKDEEQIKFGVLRFFNSLNLVLTKAKNN